MTKAPPKVHKFSLSSFLIDAHRDGRALVTVEIQQDGRTHEVQLLLAPHIYQDVLQKFRQQDAYSPLQRPTK